MDAPATGGCEDAVFADASLALSNELVAGRHVMALSDHTRRELRAAPGAVRRHISVVSEENALVLSGSREATDLAEAHLSRGVVRSGPHADALHVTLATAGRADVFVSSDSPHIVNLGGIRLCSAVNFEQGYGTIEIRTPKEVLAYEEGF